MRPLQLLPGLALAGGLGALAIALSGLPWLKVLGALMVAMLAGMALRGANAVPDATRPGIRFSARTVLRLGIVLMGVRLNFQVLAEAGPEILLLDTVIVAVGLAGIYAIARAFRVDPRIGMLLAVGTSICGASAVVAAGPVTRCRDDEVTLGVALCGVLGAIGVLLYVTAGPFLGLTPAQLGVLSGSTLHEVAQVVAAAFTFGTASGDLGTLVKLTRVVMLGPALLALGLLFRPEVTGTAGGGAGTEAGPTRGTASEKATAGVFSWRNPPVPWFVLGFLAVAGLNTLGVFGDALRGWLTQASLFLMVMAMAAMGIQTDLGAMRRSGLRLLLAGLAGFGLLAAVSYTLIRVLAIG